MKQRFRWVVAGIGVVLLLLIVAAYGYLEGWHIERVASVELSKRLEPHEVVVRPETEGPFPAVVLMHGCTGIHESNHTWAKLFADRGYAAFIVNSLAPRGLSEGSVQNGVCDGSVLWGRERAGDLLVTLARIRTLPFVDPDRIALVGWSHGGWTIMDALALDASGDLPTSLSDAPGGLEGVVANVLIYPYCGAASLSYRGASWPAASSTLLLLAAEDEMISTEACLEVAERLRSEGQRITVHVFPDVDHAFDYTGLGDNSRFKFDAEATAKAKKQVLDFLEASFGPA